MKKGIEQVVNYDVTGNPVISQGVSGDSITPSDSTILQPGSLYIGTGGNVKVKLVSGSILTFVNVQDGSWLPIKVIMVYSTDTTASDILIIR